ncbi:peptide-binding protein [soil metagenome]
MNTIRRWVAILAVGATACGGGDNQTAGGGAGQPAGNVKTLTGAPPGGSLVVLMDGEPDNLNPLTYDTKPASDVAHLIFRNLARRDTSLSNYQPDLAQSWELSPDSSSVILQLRRDVRWHDGQPVTAEDVVWTIQQQQSEGIASPRRSDVAAIGEVTARDSFTVEAKLAKPGPYAVNALLEVIPAPKHLLGNVSAEQMRTHPFGRNPVGNGIFRFVNWRPGQQLTIAANPDAPEGRPALNQIVLRFVPDANAAVTQLMGGQEGDLLKISPEQSRTLEGANNVEVHSAARVRPGWIAWNARRAPLDDVNVRRALLMGIDRNALVKGLFGERGEPALSPIPPRLAEHNPGARPIPFNPQMAGQLLDQAGWRDTNGDGIRDKGGRPLRIELEYSTADQTRNDMAVAIQAMLSRIGVQLVPKPYERTTWVSRLRAGEFQGSFWGWGWGPGVVGPNAEAVFHSRSIPPGSGVNFARYSNPRVDALIDSALVTFDPARNKQIWASLEQQLIDDAVYAPIFLDPELFGVNSRFANVGFRSIEWWEDVPLWHVPENRRMPRDRAGR